MSTEIKCQVFLLYDVVPIPCDVPEDFMAPEIVVDWSWVLMDGKPFIL